MRSSSQGSGTTAPPLTCGVPGASWRRCGPAALSCRATRSSTSLPSSASSAAPSPLRCVARLPGPLVPAGCRDPLVSLAGEEWGVEQKESSLWRGSCWGDRACPLGPHRLCGSVTGPFCGLGWAFGLHTSELSFSSVKQLCLCQPRCTYSSQFTGKGQVHGHCCLRLGGVGSVLQGWSGSL